VCRTSGQNVRWKYFIISDCNFAVHFERKKLYSSANCGVTGKGLTRNLMKVSDAAVRQKHKYVHQRRKKPVKQVEPIVLLDSAYECADTDRQTRKRLYRTQRSLSNGSRISRDAAVDLAECHKNLIGVARRQPLRPYVTLFCQYWSPRRAIHASEIAVLDVIL